MDRFPTADERWPRKGIVTGIQIDKLESLIDRTAKRKRPMYDQEMRNFLKTIDYSWNYPIDHYVQVFTEWLTSHKTNKLINLDAFPDRRIILGVTQAINDLYMMYPNRVVILEGEFFYHYQLFPNIKIKTLDTLKNGDILWISMPFCGEDYGVHPKMSEILEKCLYENIPVHVDAAWYPCSRGITFDLDHPAIQSVSCSLTKAYGISEYRSGVRYSRAPMPGYVTWMTDNDSIPCKQNFWTGIKFMDKFGPDFWWTKYGDHYDYILKHCKNLAPSPAIHVAFSTDDNGNIVKAVPMKEALLYLNTYNNGTTT